MNMVMTSAVRDLKAAFASDGVPRDYAAANKGQEACRQLLSAFNNFSSPSEIAEEIRGGLSRKEQRLLEVMVALGGLSLAYWWEEQGLNGWDLRKKYSAQLCFKNKAFLEQVVKQSIPLQYVPAGQNCPTFSSAVSSASLKEHYWAEGFISAWENAHPTLQSSVIEGFFVGVFSKKYTNRVSTVSGERFPLTGRLSLCL